MQAGAQIYMGKLRLAVDHLIVRTWPGWHFILIPNPPIKSKQPVQPVNLISDLSMQ
jgi:hypothetical protein